METKCWKYSAIQAVSVKRETIWMNLPSEHSRWTFVMQIELRVVKRIKGMACTKVEGKRLKNNSSRAGRKCMVKVSE